MHLPDGFLDARTALLSSGAAVAGVGYALRQVRISLEPRQMPMLGLTAAFVFAAQMLNFPVTGGTSGHLAGGVLASILLGPAAAVLVMACVLIVQCLMFADGGLTALGANVFNLAIVGGCGGHLVFRGLKALLRMEERRAVVFAAGFAGWCGTVLSSITCSGQLALSGTAPWSMAFPAMVNIHMLIGVGEGLATALILHSILRLRPHLIPRKREAAGTSGAGLLVYGGLVTLGLVLFVAPFASSLPDGLEAAAGALGFAERARRPAFASPLPDYQVPLVGSPAAATVAAGIIGTLVVFVAAYLLARALAPTLGPRKEDATTGR
jgi:cobalt/nickel transport system permease protein